MTNPHPYREISAHPPSQSSDGETDRGNSASLTWDSKYAVTSTNPGDAVGIMLTMDNSRWLLVVEDNPGDLVLLQMAVGPAALEQLRHLPDGEQALALLHELALGDPRLLPDVIILDLNLPRIDGHQVMERMRSEKALRGIGILVLTSSGSPVERRRALAEGADVYCTKPIDLEAYLGLPAVIEETRQNRDRRIRHAG